MARMSKIERTSRDVLMRNLIYLMQEKWIPRVISDELPEEWHSLLHDVEVTEKKQKLTLYLDRSVAKFFRDMGVGYQARINAVLSTFARMHITRHVELEKRLNKVLELGTGPGKAYAEWNGMGE